MSKQSGVWNALGTSTWNCKLHLVNLFCSVFIPDVPNTWIVKRPDQSPIDLLCKLRLTLAPWWTQPRSCLQDIKFKHPVTASTVEICIKKPASHNRKSKSQFELTRLPSNPILPWNLPSYFYSLSTSFHFVFYFLIFSFQFFSFSTDFSFNFILFNSFNSNNFHSISIKL